MELLLELNFKQKKATLLLIGLIALLGFGLSRNNWQACAVWGVISVLLLRNPKYVYIFLNTIGRDVVAIGRVIRLNIYLVYVEFKGWTLARVFQETVKRKPFATCFRMSDHCMTFQEVDHLSTKIGAYFHAQGLAHGDAVALFMETRLEYACTWLGLSKIGVISALINSNLRRETLFHSIRVAKPKAIIVSTVLSEILEEVLTTVDELKTLPIYQYSDQKQGIEFKPIRTAIDLSLALQKQPLVDLSAHIRRGSPRDTLMYVYTSGTTGLPKPAVITNLRYTFMASAAHHISHFREDDVFYNALPLYHTAGGIVAVGNALVHGCCVVLRTKFSASNFWKDCIKYECTVAQYIGEICRYLLSTPPTPEDDQHKLRMMFGNGLRPQVWSQFVSRFNIPHIAEFYGATEGNCNLANVWNQVGAIGFVPGFGRKIFPVQLIKCDEETGEVLREGNGYCQRCVPGETGVLIGLVNHKRAAMAFQGYADRGASEKKLLRNVFRKGDCYFNSGDMMVSDILGYMYFKDRTGDTFRWKGENVSTLEVEAIITNVIGLQDCVVYGVEIPHLEGRAGMAAIVDPEESLDLAHLSAGIRGSLPKYAQPIFLRLMKEIPRTETFKLKKHELIKDGFDIRNIKDPVYYLNKDGVYRLLQKEEYENLMNGRVSL